MTIQLTNLRIRRIIAHQVFKRTITGEMVNPKFSTEQTILDQPGTTALQTRITEALGNDSHSIEMFIEQSDDGSTYDYCNKLIESNAEEFVAVSQSLAEKLAHSQTSQNIPGGIVVIFDGLIGQQDNRLIGIIKAEIHEGFSLQTSTDKLLLTFISDLLLTPSQRLYKI
ncbi:nucleoid-associated protein, partial [Chloroflexota bacterium]